MTRAPSQRRSIRRHLVAAYTVVEVMMALSILSIGATGVIAMQKASLVGNVRARDLATANAIAAAWMERLRVDALRWTVQPGDLSTISQTEWLKVVGNDYPTVNSPEGEWFRPTDLPAMSIAAGADVRGMDTVTQTQQGFCTHLRLTQVLPNLIRAEVRVFWLRNQGGGTIDGGALCDVNPAALAAPAADLRYHFVHLVSGITRHES